jgi:hypothetical protein
VRRSVVRLVPALVAPRARVARGTGARRGLWACGNMPHFRPLKVSASLHIEDTPDGTPLCTELATSGRSTIPGPRRPARGPGLPRSRLAAARGGRSEISGGPRYRMSHLATFV